VSRRACNPSCGVQFRLVGDRVVLEKVEDEGPQRAQEADGGFLCAAGCDHRPACLTAGPVAINALIDGDVAFAYEGSRWWMRRCRFIFTTIGRFPEKLPFWRPAPMPLTAPEVAHAK